MRQLICMQNSLILKKKEKSIYNIFGRESWISSLVNVYFKKQQTNITVIFILCFLIGIRDWLMDFVDVQTYGVKNRI